MTDHCGYRVSKHKSRRGSTNKGAKRSQSVGSLEKSKRSRNKSSSPDSVDDAAPETHQFLSLDDVIEQSTVRPVIAPSQVNGNLSPPITSQVQVKDTGELSEAEKAGLNSLPSAASFPSSNSSQSLVAGKQRPRAKTFNTTIKSPLKVKKYLTLVKHSNSVRNKSTSTTDRSVKSKETASEDSPSKLARRRLMDFSKNPLVSALRQAANPNLRKISDVIRDREFWVPDNNDAESENVLTDVQIGDLVVTIEETCQLNCANTGSGNVPVPLTL